MDHFILLTEYSVNHDMVQFARFDADGSVHLHMGANMLSFTGDDAATLKTAFGYPPPPPPATQAAKGTAEHHANKK